MTVGDIKGPEAVIIQGTLGDTTTKGQIVHLESDGKWDPTTDTDPGKFGVAHEAGADTEEVPIVIWGRVEVYASGAVKKGQLVMANDATGATANAGRAVTADFGAEGEVIGTAMEAAASDGTAFTLFVGLVG